MIGRTLMITFLILQSWTAVAQNSEVPPPSDDFAAPSTESEGVEVESLYDKFDQDQTKKRQAQKQEHEAKKAKEATNLSELSDLAPFADVAVIERRFLPRTKRFEMSASGMTSVNNPFFNNLGLALRGAYYLSEKHGIDLTYMLFSSSSRSVTKNLESDRGVRTTNLVSPKSFLGIAYKWTPIYGKISFLNHRIVPFDLYFNAGLGMTSANKKNEPTTFLATGQSFAITKSFALRWDFSWSFYQAEVDAISGTGTVKSTHNDLFLSAGVSFFVPEATYR